MAHRKLKVRTMSTALAFAAATGSALAPRTAAAYGPEGHQRVTDLAWQVMNAAQHKDKIVFTATTPADLTAVPAGADASEWATFLATVKAATERLPDVKAGTDPPVTPASGCWPGAYPVDREKIRDCRLAELKFAPTKAWKLDDDHCQADASYHPGGIYDDFLPSLRSPYMGMLLGRLANEPDNDRNDLSIWVRAHTSTLTPVGPYLNGLSEGVELFLTAFFAIPVCAAALITGENCLDKAAQIADDANFVEEAIGLIPGLFSTSYLMGQDIMGLWHFLHLQAPPGEYNDIRGMHFDYAGPVDGNGNNKAGVIDVATSAITDILGYGINVSESTGVRRYEGAKTRTKGDWQAPNLGHVEMNPLDNYADWGWRNYTGKLGDTSTKAGLGYLARPLHAFGDVSIPGHVLGTVGWGHGPMENAVEDSWSELVLQAPGRSKYNDEEKLQQLAQARRILEEGFRWWKWVKTYKESHPTVDIPVSAWINAIAQETLANAGPLLSDEASTLDILNQLFQATHADAALEAFAQALTDAYVASVNSAIEGFGLGTPIPSPDVQIGGIPNLYHSLLPLVRKQVEASAGAKLAFLSLVGATYSQPLLSTDTTACANLGSACPATAPYPVADECHPCPAGKSQSAGTCVDACAAGEWSKAGVCVPACGAEDFSQDTGSTPICVHKCPEGSVTVDGKKNCTTIDIDPGDLPPIGPVK